MTVYMTANSWWTSFYNCDMVVSNFDDCPFCFLFSILVTCVCALVLLAGGFLVFCVRYLVLCASTAVLIVCLCLFFLCLCLAIVECSTLRTAGVDIVGNC